MNTDASVPGGVTASVIRRLQSQVESGDAAGAYQLFFLLNRCAAASEYSKNLRASVARGLKMAPERVEDAEAAAKDCKSVSPDLIAKRTEFLDLAASKGDIRAQVQFGAYPPNDLKTEEDFVKHPEKVAEYKSKTMSYLGAAAEQGATSAFATLAGIYREGVIADKDPVKSLAYFLALTEVNPNVDPKQSVRQYYEAGMSPEQIGRAQELHQQILRRCCR